MSSKDDEYNDIISNFLKSDRKSVALISEDYLLGINRHVIDEFVPSWQRPLPEFVVSFSNSPAPPSLSSPHCCKHAKFLSRLDRVMVFGIHHFHGLLNEHGSLACQVTNLNMFKGRLEYHIANQQRPNQAMPWFDREDGYYYCFANHLKKDNIIKIGQSVFFGSPIEPDNWGMWLLNGLPSMKDFIKYGNGCKYLCWVRFPWQINLLRFMGIKAEDLIVQEPLKTYFCDSVLFHQYSEWTLAPTETDKAVFMEIRDRCGRSDDPRFEKIFVSRLSLGGPSGRRVLTNEQELISAMENKGFFVIEPQNYSFEEQVRIFGSAKVVVGLGGVGMFNTIFCDEGTRVVSIEGCSDFAHNHASLFAGMGLRYGFIFGQQDLTDPTPIHKNWTLDVPEALRQISGFI